MSADFETLRVADRRQLRAHLDQTTCECGGALQIVSEEPSDGAGEQLALVLNCALCGLSGRLAVAFTGSRVQEEAHEPNSDVLPEPRSHHYAFGHIALPQLYLGDPAGFINAFPVTDLGYQRLLRLWIDVGADSEEALPARGLQIRRETVIGATCPVIVMPKTVGAAEVAFAALFCRDPKYKTTARYLVLERTEVSHTSEPFGVICEWFADRTRKNHERRCRTELASFIETLERLLQDEDQLGSEGAFGLPAWDPSADDPGMFAFDRAGYRRALCRLAFESIPACLEEEIDAIVHGTESGEGGSALIQALKKRLPSGDEHTQALKLLAAESDVREVRTGERRLLVIAMPRALAAPEPQYVAAVFDRNSQSLERAYECTAVYTSEMTIPGGNAPRLLCCISAGNHSILSDLHEPTLEAFASAILQHLSGVTGPCNTNALDHLVLYAAIHSQQ